ncbi:glutamate receptor [Trichonephila clavipes]|nr:glutamate receptor [Trichonephila clavipes]
MDRDAWDGVKKRPFTLTYGRFSDFKLSAPMYVDDVEILVPVFEWKLSLFNMLAIFDYQSWLEIYANLQSRKMPKSISDKVPYRFVTTSRKASCNATFTSSDDTKRRPCKFFFIDGERQMSHGAKSGEKGDAEAR